MLECLSQLLSTVGKMLEQTEDKQKLKMIKIDACPVKDSKVVKYVEKGEIKNLLKYLEKQGPSRGGGGKGKKGKNAKKGNA